MEFLRCVGSESAKVDLIPQLMGRPGMLQGSTTLAQQASLKPTNVTPDCCQRPSLTVRDIQVSMKLKPTVLPAGT